MNWIKAPVPNVLFFLYFLHEKAPNTTLSGKNNPVSGGGQVGQVATISSSKFCDLKSQLYSYYYTVIVHLLFCTVLEYPEEMVEVVFKGTPIVPIWSECKAQQIAYSCIKALLLFVLGIVFDIFEVCTAYIIVMRASALCLGLKEASLAMGPLIEISLVADHNYLSTILKPAHVYFLFDIILVYTWFASLRLGLSLDLPVGDRLDIRTSIPSGM